MPFNYCHATGLNVPECSCPECIERMIALHAVTLIDHNIPITRDEVSRIEHQHTPYPLTFDALRTSRSA